MLYCLSSGHMLLIFHSNTFLKYVHCSQLGFLFGCKLFYYMIFTLSNIAAAVVEKLLSRTENIYVSDYGHQDTD